MGHISDTCEGGEFEVCTGLTMGTKGMGQGDLQSTKQRGKKRNKGRARTVTASCQRDHRVWESSKTPRCVRACVSAHQTHCPGWDPGFRGDAAMANPHPGGPHLMLSLKTEGGGVRAINEGGGKTVWVNAFPTLFRLVSPFASKGVC